MAKKNLIDAVLFAQLVDFSDYRLHAFSEKLFRALFKATKNLFERYATVCAQTGLQFGNPFKSEQPVRFVNLSTICDRSRKPWFNLVMESCASQIRRPGSTDRKTTKNLMRLSKSTSCSRKTLPVNWPNWIYHNISQTDLGWQSRKIRHQISSFTSSASKAIKKGQNQHFVGNVLLEFLSEITLLMRVSGF